MSRSIGDGECKGVGVIADPEVSHMVLTPAEKASADGALPPPACLCALAARLASSFARRPLCPVAYLVTLGR